MARIAALLSPYYEKDIPQAVRRLEAEDWAAELGEYPQWAVEKAVRWWKSSDNADRRKRPFEGDISARCRVEMGPVNAAKIYLSQPLQSSPRECEPHERQEPSEVDVAHRRKVAAEIMADFNKGKGFPKVGEGKE